MRSFAVVSCVTLLAVGGWASGSFAHMGAKFEPADGQVIHGLGQYVPAAAGYSDADNWQFVTDYQTAVGHVPVIYAAYQAIDPVVAFLDNTDLTDIVQNHGHPYHLNLGLFLFDLTQENIDVAAILGGDYDTQIAAIAAEVKALGVSTFCRPGFEFGAPDGLHGDNISGPDFILVWHYIRGVFDTVGVENVAWVWNAVNPNTFNYMSYYPGDAAVDWWGINYFTTSQMNNSEAFVLDAATHGKPVIICESCPIHNGGTGNAANWQNWFVPYFGKITGHAHLKAFTYISDPWDRPGFFDWWDTSLIDANTPATLRTNYAAEMDDSRYIHHGPLQALTLTVVNDAWGDVEIVPDPVDANDPDLLGYLPGMWVRLEANAIDGKGFKQWELYDPNHPGDANHMVVDANAVTLLTMDADHEVTGVFKCGSGVGVAFPLMALAACAVAFAMRRRHPRR